MSKLFLLMVLAQANQNSYETIIQNLRSNPGHTFLCIQLPEEATRRDGLYRAFVLSQNGHVHAFDSRQRLSEYELIATVEDMERMDFSDDE